MTKKVEDALVLGKALGVNVKAIADDMEVKKAKIKKSKDEHDDFWNANLYEEIMAVLKIDNGPKNAGWAQGLASGYNIPLHEAQRILDEFYNAADELNGDLRRVIGEIEK